MLEPTSILASVIPSGSGTNITLPHAPGPSRDRNTWERPPTSLVFLSRQPSRLLLLAWAGLKSLEPLFLEERDKRLCDLILPRPTLPIDMMTPSLFHRPPEVKIFL